MGQLVYTIVWDEAVRPQDANAYAVDLQKVLSEEAPELQTKIERQDKDAQDLGAFLIAALSTGAALAIARGIKQFIARRGDLASITIKTPDGTEIRTERITRKAALELTEQALAAAFRSADEPE